MLLYICMIEHIVECEGHPVCLRLVSARSQHYVNSMQCNACPGPPSVTVAPADLGQQSYHVQSAYFQELQVQRQIIQTGLRIVVKLIAAIGA